MRLGGGNKHKTTADFREEREICPKAGLRFQRRERKRRTEREEKNGRWSTFSKKKTKRKDGEDRRHDGFNPSSFFFFFFEKHVAYSRKEIQAVTRLLSSSLRIHLSCGLPRGTYIENPLLELHVLDVGLEWIY